MTWLTVRFNLGVELLMVVRRTRLIALLAVFLLVLGAFPALADDNSFESVSPEEGVVLVNAEAVERLAQWREENVGYRSEEVPGQLLDRKSTRLNSSHVAISYAVFCLKKKNTI